MTKGESIVKTKITPNEALKLAENIHGMIMLILMIHYEDWIYI